MPCWSATPSTLAGAEPGTGETGAGGKGAVGATQPPGRIRHASDRASLPTARYTTRSPAEASLRPMNAIRHAAHSDPAHAVKISIQCMQPPGREWFCASTF